MSQEREHHQKQLELFRKELEELKLVCTLRIIMPVLYRRQSSIMNCSGFKWGSKERAVCRPEPVAEVNSAESHAEIINHNTAK